MEPLAVSINDAAKTLGLGRTLIYAMINDGRLDAFKLGRRTLVTTESIRRLADAQGRDVRQDHRSPWPKLRAASQPPTTRRADKTARPRPERRRIAAAGWARSERR